MRSISQSRYTCVYSVPLFTCFAFHGCKYPSGIFTLARAYSCLGDNFVSPSYLVTGNANFHMTQTTFTLLGFTQPQTAMPIIEDKQNNAKGFTSRLLWYFPRPVFCKMQDTVLTDEEKLQVTHFKDELGK